MAQGPLVCIPEFPLHDALSSMKEVVLTAIEEVQHDETEPNSVFQREGLEVLHASNPNARNGRISDQFSPHRGTVLQVRVRGRHLHRASVLTDLVGILADLQREIDQRCNYADRTNELTNVAEILERQRNILRGLTDRR